MRVFWFGPLILVAGLCLSATSQAAPTLDPQLRDYIQTKIKTGDYVGVIVGIVDNGETGIYSFGTIEKGAETPPTPDTVFEIGSITKTFTATILADMALKSDLALDDPVQLYLPADISLAVRGDRPITLADLATHRSGLPRLPDNFDPAEPLDPYADYDRNRLWDAVNTLNPGEPAGTAFQYSNFGYAVLGQILVRHSGTAYRDLVRDRITAPLGMTSTDTVLTDAMAARAATGYGPTGRATPHWTFKAFAPAGAIHSTLADMLTYIRAQMGGIDATIGNAIQQTHPVRARAMGDLDIGLAWLTTADGRGRWHDGGTRGFASFAGFLKEGTRGTVVLANTMTSVNAIGRRILNPAFDLPKASADYSVIDIDPRILADYVGKYRLQKNQIMTVRRSDGRLFVQFSGQDPLPVYPYEPDRFFAKAVNAQIHFIRDESSTVEALVVRQGGTETRMNRINEPE